jgi:large-conductance mechanosensitive channel
MSIISKINLLENNDLGNNHSILVSRKMDVYFNELLNVPDAPQIGGTKTTYGFGKFYSEYIEHNLLLLFIILCLIIFLIIKYVNKNSESTPNNNLEDNDTTDTDTTDTTEANTNKTRTKKEKLLKKKLSNEKKRQLLELEKQSILDIIDELSNINYKKIQTNNQMIKHAQSQAHDFIESKYVEPSEHTHINNYPQTNAFTNRMIEQSNYEPVEQFLQQEDFSLINSNYLSDNNTYYNVNKNMDYTNENNPNYIKGLYIESPYEQ